jgi:DNA invertase Pin-like site-specific DNA recombinase
MSMLRVFTLSTVVSGFRAVSLVMRAIRYHRFSSKRQDRGSSLERQNDATRILCEAKGWDIVETLEDRGQSAWKGDHLSVGHLGKLRKRIDVGLIEPPVMLVVENIDRLSRQDYRTARRWIEDVTDRGVTIAVCHPALMLDRDAMSGANIGPMIQHLLEANRASAEGDRKSVFQRRNIERMTDMIRQGICPTPRAPAWLIAKVGERIAVNKRRAALVNLIYEWSANGLGMQSICQRLNAEHDPWTGSGWKTNATQWRIGYVRDILNSPAIEGKYVVRGAGRETTGEVITGYYPRIVDADLVARARVAKSRRARTGGAHRGDAANLFVGIITCGVCRGAVGRVTGGKGYAYMTCRNARYGTCTNKAGMSYSVLSKVVVDHLLHLALDETDFAAIDDIAPLVAKVAASRSKLDDLRSQQNNIIRALRTLSGSAGLLNELAHIEAEISAAEADLAEHDAALSTARGTISPREHLHRVDMVRDSLDSDAEARRIVRDALPSLISRMVWTGSKVSIISRHFFMDVSRTGEVSGWDLFHPRAGHAADPAYGRRRDAAQEAGVFPPLLGGTRRDPPQC